MFDAHLISAQLAEREQTALLSRAADDSHVRQVVLAAATRMRNVSVLMLAGASALVMLALGMTWSGLGTLGFGTLLYGSLMGRDAVSQKFVGQLFSLSGDEEEDIDVISEEPNPATPSMEGLESELRNAYWGVLLRRSQLQERINTGPAILQASLPEANRICDALLTHAQRLIARGRRLRSYLKSTQLDDLSDSLSMVALQSAASTDLVASRIYRQVLNGRQRHIATHLEVEGLYDRVLAQLMLIETTLAGVIARLVKITAADDEETPLTASLITKQLEVLVTDVKFLEESLDEISQDDSVEFAGELCE